MKKKNMSKSKLSPAVAIRKNSLRKGKNLKLALGGAIVHKRTPEQTQEIFTEFLKNIDEFSSFMKYGKEEIEKIGVDKFLDAFDWSAPEQTQSWKSDKYHIVPCCDCGENFAVFEEYALCPICSQKYDLDKLHLVLSQTAEDVANSSKDKSAVIAEHAINTEIYAFSTDENLRKMFIKK